MSADGAKSNLLGLSVDLIKKTFMCKRTIISMIVLYGAIRLGHDLFKGLDGQNCLVHCVISRQMDVDEITDMITKCGTSPNMATSEEVRHLWNKPWLSRDNLID